MKLIFFFFLFYVAHAAPICPRSLSYIGYTANIAAEDATLLTKLERFARLTPLLENSIISLLRGESKIATVTRYNDEVILALEAIFNHFNIETVSNSKNILFRKKNAKYMTLQYFKNQDKSIDLLFARLKHFTHGPNIQAIVYQLIAGKVNKSRGFGKANLLVGKANKEKGFFHNSYEASLFSNSTISPTPKHNNYLDASELYDAIDKIYATSSPLYAPKLFSKSLIIKQLKVIQEELSRTHQLATDLQRLSSFFAQTATERSQSKNIDLKNLWTIVNGQIKIVDDKKRALYSFIDRKKQTDIDQLKNEIKNMESWLVRNDLHELLGNGVWMSTGPTDLAQTSHFNNFQKRYNTVLLAQQSILLNIAKEQKSLNKLTLKIKSEFNHLWQELYQIQEALKASKVDEIEAPLKHFRNNLRLFFELAKN